MKKKLLYVFTIAIALFSSFVFADDQGTQKHQIYAKTTDVKYNGDVNKLSPADFPNGLYVLVEKGLFTKVRFPKIEEFFTQRLKDAGFKIADSKATADAVFVPFSSIDFAEIENGKNDNLKRGLSIADDFAGIALGAKFNGAQSLILNGTNFTIHKKNGFFTADIQAKDKSKSTASSVAESFEYSEDTPEASALLLASQFNDWAKAHIVATSASTSSTVEENSAAK